MLFIYKKTFRHMLRGWTGDKSFCNMLFYVNKATCELLFTIGFEIGDARTVKRTWKMVCPVYRFRILTLLFPVVLAVENLTASSVSATMLTTTNVAKVGCKDKCGNVTIPYPFGIVTECSLGRGFEIYCHTTNNVSVPKLNSLGSEVLEISEMQLHVLNPPGAYVCGEPQANTITNKIGLPWVVAGKPFAYSSTDNKYIVMGCQHYGFMSMTGTSSTSCVALCDKNQDLYDSTCSGNGCCQVSIPKSFQHFNIYLERVYYDTNVTAGNCTYALLAESSKYRFRGAIDIVQPGFLQKIEKLPYKLDWFIPNLMCREAQQNSTSYVCQQNTTCVDLDKALNLKGYRCNCWTGYEGNPYLTPGCKDINECITGVAGQGKPCSDICHNTPGSYNCSCPSGFLGDGLKGGIGCFPKTSRSFLGLGIGVGVGSVVIHLVGFLLFTVVRRRRAIMQKAKNFKRNGGLLLQQQMFSEQGVLNKTRIFTADELKKATDNFNSNRELGQGGQGTVYKGMMLDGSIVAVKKSKLSNERQVNEFINEVVILSQINHRNIVKLLGCCLETEVPLLVYEYVPNGTLSRLIHDPSEDFPVSWEMRLQIATSVAGALAYLHSASSKPIFHRDIKTSNILLDAKYRAKVSDFGTSRSIDVDQTHLTTRVQGTFGYLDPEYFRSNQFTDKSDVYSFGVVLLELLTGQKAIRHGADSPSSESLVSWFLSTRDMSDLYNILAPQVAKDDRKEGVLAIANLARRCLNLDGKQRPTMKEVALELEVISSKHDAPIMLRKNTLETDGEMLTDMTDSAIGGLFPPSTSDLNSTLNFI